VEPTGISRQVQEVFARSLPWVIRPCAGIAEGVELVIALIAALTSLAITAATLWGAVETADWLDPARPR
jgi:hypothetical protein